MSAVAPGKTMRMETVGSRSANSLRPQNSTA